MKQQHKAPAPEVQEETYLIKEDNTGLYWNNDDGFGDEETATVFTLSEKRRLNLPIGGRWVSNSTPVKEDGFTKGDLKVVRIGEAWKVKEWAAIATIQYGGGDSDFVILAPTNTQTLLHMEAEANAARIVECWNNYDKVKADNEKLLAANRELIEALQGFIDNVITDKKIYDNQISYYKGQFRKAIQKHSK